MQNLKYWIFDSEKYCNPILWNSVFHVYDEYFIVSQVNFLNHLSFFPESKEIS